MVSNRKIALQFGRLTSLLLILASLTWLMPGQAQQRLKDGYYKVANPKERATEPTYGLLVENGKVTADFSFDDYGCMGGSCDFPAIIKNTQYLPINESQILRQTPDGKSVVLLWYKNLGE